MDNILPNFTRKTACSLLMLFFLFNSLVAADAAVSTISEENSFPAVLADVSNAPDHSVLSSIGTVAAPSLLSSPDLSQDTDFSSVTMPQTLGFSNVPNSPAPDNNGTSFSGNNNLTEYRLGKYDVIDISIYGFDEGHYKDLMVGPDGYIRLPFAGWIKVEGLTVSKATEVIRARLDKYLVIPDMVIMVKGYGPREVYVMGEVKNPGLQKLSWQRMNVMAAISGAGGILYKGRPKHVLVTRIRDGQTLTREINYEDLIRKADFTQNVALEDGDLVYVPKADHKIDFFGEVMPILQGLFFIDQIKK